VPALDKQLQARGRLEGPMIAKCEPIVFTLDQRRPPVS